MKASVNLVVCYNSCEAGYSKHYYHLLLITPVIECTIKELFAQPTFV